jgi:alpha,alpha-trehalase
MNARRSRSLFALTAATILILSAQQPAPQFAPVEAYIQQTWHVLTRSNRGLASAAADPKFHPGADGRWPVYIPPSANLQTYERELRSQMDPGDYRKIALRRLPGDLAKVQEQGLLLLPQPYVVPGGRFNEMYGWDSYFIQLGLLRDGELELAKDMADNFAFEIKNYGKILNANRTYYLTRSQPPFFTQMLLGVYRKTNDREWLQSAYPMLESYYRFWTTEPHLTPATGLSRYYDLGDGPAPEVEASERNAEGRTHYDLVRAYYRTHEVPDYEVGEYYDRGNDRLTMLFYKGDRSMRESGFDPSNRFGPFNVDIIHYNPVCLNSLLYLMETQAAEIARILGREPDASAWDGRARERAARINELMWDPQDGLYYDYEFVHKRKRHYPYLTTFYPLWAGIATREQAAAVVKNLGRFEVAGGLQTSTTRTGNQWDAPFGWAPLHLIAVKGLRRYGYGADADRISEEFLSLINDEYRKLGTIVEKYDVVRRATNTFMDVKFGYSSNEKGFGWTNAVFTALLDDLPQEKRSRLNTAP